MDVDPDDLTALVADLTDGEIARLVDELPPEAVAKLLTTIGGDSEFEAAARWLYDPTAFALEAIRWEDDALTSYQAATLELLPRAKRVAVRGPHSLGKTAEAAITLIWFALTREAAGIDWKVVSTASVWRQLSKYLWPEVHKWAKRLRWDVIGRDAFTDRELLTMQIKLRHGEAFAVASNDEQKIEGAHADHILYLLDEAKAIPDLTWDAIEGALAGAGSDTAQEAYALAISTPGSTSNRFHSIALNKPGYEDWTTRHVTLSEAITAGRISADWAEQRKRQWGETSALYRNRVLGEFADTSTDSVIPLPWIEAAQERWHDFSPDFGPITHVGVDVARFGDDDTVVALRHGYAVSALHSRHGLTTTEVANVALSLADNDLTIPYVVDVVGLGAGVVDQLRDRHKCKNVVAFSAGEGTKQTDRSGEVGFVNKRSAMWWAMREALDPANDPKIALPPDDDLAADLSAPTWRDRNGKIQVESKDEIRKRLGRSTDRADAVLQAFVSESGTRAKIHRAADLGRSITSGAPTLTRVRR